MLTAEKCSDGRVLAVWGTADGQTTLIAMDRNRNGNGMADVEKQVADQGAFGPRLIERRSGGDRRRQGYPRPGFLVSGGRRTRGRRYEDRQRMICLDRYGQSHFGIIALILLFSLMDALLTLELIQRGAIELNPIMAFYLSIDPRTFLLVKYGLTSAGVIILLLFNGFVMRPLRVRVGILLYFVLAAFLGVFSWQVFLIHRVVA